MSSAISCGTRPTFERAARYSRAMSWPSTRTCPEVIETMPQMTPISVVLPAPLGPRSAKISPFAISKLTASIAVRPDLYLLVTAETETIGDIDAPYRHARPSEATERSEERRVGKE